MDFSGFLQTRSIEWWTLLLAIISIVVAWILSRVARKGVRALLGRASGVSETLAAATSRAVGYAVLLLGIGVALALLGANVQPLLAVVVIVGIVAVLVLRGVADNFAAGVLIQTRRPVQLGDEIVIDGPDGTLTGVVKDLNSRSVVLATHDGRTAHVPNAHLLQSVIVNDSTHGSRRSEVEVRLGREGGTVEELIDQLVAAVATVDGIHRREPVRALITAMSADRFIVRLQFWHGPRAAPAIVSRVVSAVAGVLEDAHLSGTVTSEKPATPLTPPDQV